MPVNVVSKLKNVHPEENRFPCLLLLLVCVFGFFFITTSQLRLSTG